MALKLILTGATGFVGEGILLACLDNPQISDVLIVNRRHYDRHHPKLRECLVPNFMNLDEVKEQFMGYDACFYCAGISSVGMNEADYTHITYELTLNFARTLLEVNPGIVFNFVSGGHTDSSERGNVMWARVKGKTENALMRLPFKAEYNFRPGAMVAYPGQKNTKATYKMAVQLFVWFSPKRVLPLQQIAQAMINVVQQGAPQPVLEISDIRQVAHQ